MEVSHVWKRFKADTGRPLFRDQMERVRNRLTGRTGGGWTWALKDIDARIAPGESVALVGLNGSGKTTLLKVLSQIMYVNSGSVRVGGRIGSIIEVRTGIHPDLTGRENIFFYGTVLGLTRREVAARFDAIIEFAELEDAVDRQVKFYSTGMQMRLGFSIAAFLDPDVLLVDEVLAVGDVSFQQRCIDRMREVLNQGTTLVFVSHDMAAVESMCARALWLDDALLKADGPVREVLGEFRQGVEEKAAGFAAMLGDPVRVTSVTAQSPDGGVAQAGGPMEIFLALEADRAARADLCLGVTEGPGLPIFVMRNHVSIPEGHSEFRCEIDSLPLPRGGYYFWAGAFDDAGRAVMSWHPLRDFKVDGAGRDTLPKGIMVLSPVQVSARWSGAEPVASPVVLHALDARIESG